MASREENFAFRILMKPGIMMYEMNCSEKEHSLIHTTENLLCCVSVPIFFLPDLGDEGCSCTLSKFPDARFNLKVIQCLILYGHSFTVEVYWLKSVCCLLDVSRLFTHHG